MFFHGGYVDLLDGGFVRTEVCDVNELANGWTQQLDDFSEECVIGANRSLASTLRSAIARGKVSCRGSRQRANLGVAAFTGALEPAYRLARGQTGTHAASVGGADQQHSLRRLWAAASREPAESGDGRV